MCSRLFRGTQWMLLPLSVWMQKSWEIRSLVGWCMFRADNRLTQAQTHTHSSSALNACIVVQLLWGSSRRWENVPFLLLSCALSCSQLNFTPCIADVPLVHRLRGLLQVGWFPPCVGISLDSPVYSYKCHSWLNLKTYRKIEDANKIVWMQESVFHKKAKQKHIFANSVVAAVRWFQCEGFKVTLDKPENRTFPRLWCFQASSATPPPTWISAIPPLASIWRQWRGKLPFNWQQPWTEPGIMVDSHLPQPVRLRERNAKQQQK